MIGLLIGNMVLLVTVLITIGFELWRYGELRRLMRTYRNALVELAHYVKTITGNKPLPLDVQAFLREAEGIGGNHRKPRKAA
jgi:hypothetical protein